MFSIRSSNEVFVMASWICCSLLLLRLMETVILFISVACVVGAACSGLNLDVLEGFEGKLPD